MSKKLGIIWCFIHFALEVICYHFYTLFFDSSKYAVILVLAYDILAFLPQMFIGGIAERMEKMQVGKIGAEMVLLGSLSALLFDIEWLRILGFIVLSLGNAFVHVGGAKATLGTCSNKITPSAIFIAGGAFGVIAGKLLGTFEQPFAIGVFIMSFGTVLVFYADSLYDRAEKYIPLMNMADDRRNVGVVIMLAFFVVAVRGLLSFGIPMTWNRSWQENLLLFCMMGVGKALGGIFSDAFGAKKTALISTALSLPLLLLGDKIMWVSLVGIALFSMTMAATLGILVSALPEHPLVAYGLSVSGLLAGTLPAFYAPVKNFVSNAVFLAVLTAVCFAALAYIMKKDVKIPKTGG
ncbi:MAG: hypothetical protein IJR45_06605 [Firmicutes bacterium]|nr:hypothetical protein [Bacillota bacterium]